MRKLSALFILIVVFFPLAFTAMTLTSIRPWVLDRGFYERLVNDERLYESLLIEDLPNQFNQEIFTAGEQLPLTALRSALRGVVTPSYLRTQSLNVINEVFNYLEGEGQVKNFELSLDITPIKVALAGEGRLPFAAALATELPNCSAGQQPIAPGGQLTRCIAAEGNVDAAAEQIAGALPSVLANTPDYIVLNDRVNLRMNWYDFNWFRGMSVRTTLDMALLMTIFIAAAAGFMGAFLGGDELRGRLQWLGASLFAPASLFVFAGLILTSSQLANTLSNSLTVNFWGGAQYSEAYREALVNVLVPVMQQVGNGFLFTGGFVCLIALVFLIWSWVTPAKVQLSHNMVQVPAQNS